MWTLSVGLSLAALGSSAPAPSSKVACVRASEEGQDLRDRRQLSAARASFVTCAAQSCPPVVREACQGWLQDVEQRLPTVIIRAREDSGRDLVEVRVRVDGEVRASELDGRTLSVDPGMHTFRFELEDGRSAEQSVLVREGEKNRFVDVTFRPPTPTATAPPSPPPVLGGPDRVTEPQAAFAETPPLVARRWGVRPWLTSGLGALAVGGGVAFGVLASDAKRGVDSLRATCAPICSESAVDAERHKLLAANISLALAAVAAVSILVVWLWPEERTSPATDRGAAAMLGL
jgi:hypothetical protein